MRPPVTYFGGKVGLASKIVALMPPHRVYLEPFFGSGAVFFAKPPVTHEIVNDLDGAVAVFFRVLRDHPDDLEQACRLTPYARDEYEAADLDEPGLSDLEVARRWWVRVNQSFGKTAGTQTGWSVTVARTQATSATTWSRIGRFAPAAARLMQTSIENRPAVDVIRRLATGEDTLVYCDPPYFAATRSFRGPGAADYREDMPTEDQHVALAEVLHETPATVLLSGYPSPLYEELYAGWWFTDFEVTAHSSNASTGKSRTGRVERLWANRALDEGRFAFG